ncbi:MAG: Type 1 glutamine amidotransferase-like domain-containing protein [Zoogloeaceae bacterium]|jgi:dipeptidase E|nr:Type 1 glutamine amidotransferase-like domain-containing protein [Zoogloeaceae bacterium]
MKTLFLSAYFSGVAKRFPDFAGGAVTGKKVAFIPTASRPEKVTFYVDADKKTLAKLGFSIRELEISSASAPEIEEGLETADYIFVEGGNTFFLLQELKRTGADKAILRQIDQGKPYIGASAGSMILAPSIEYAQRMDDAAAAPRLNGDFSALAAVDFCVVPHFTNAPFRKAAQQIVAEYAQRLDLRSISNHEAIVVRGNRVETLAAPVRQRKKCAQANISESQRKENAA